MNPFKGLAATLVVSALALPAAAATATPVSAKGAAGQVLTVSNTKLLPAAGSWVTVSGKRFDETVGIYVALCVVRPKGQVPSPCGGGVDKSGSSKASAWISSNPPRYGIGLAMPYKIGGVFKVKIKVGPRIGKYDCRKVKCAVVAKADHMNPEYRGADVSVPVTFRKK